MNENRLTCRALAGILVVATVSLAATMAFAQNGTGEQDYKIGPPEFRDSDTAFIPIGPIHITNAPPTPSAAGWAGVIVGVHVLDNREVDVDSVSSLENTSFPMLPVNVPDPLGPRSNNVQSQTRYVKLLHNEYALSGIDVQNSQVLPGDPTPGFPLGGVNIHVKGTNVGENSDTDLVVQVYNIWHVRQDSLVLDLKNSDLVWGAYDQPPYHYTNASTPTDPLNSVIVVPMGTGIANSTTPGGSGLPGGRWWHIQAPVPGAVPVHFFASQYFATLADTITVGIEHIPEPASMMLFGLGAACAVVGVRSRCKRRN